MRERVEAVRALERERRAAEEDAYEARQAAAAIAADASEGKREERHRLEELADRESRRVLELEVLSERAHERLGALATDPAVAAMISAGVRDCYRRLAEAVAKIPADAGDEATLVRPPGITPEELAAARDGFQAFHDQTARLGRLRRIHASIAALRWSRTQASGEPDFVINNLGGYLMKYHGMIAGRSDRTPLPTDDLERVRFELKHLDELGPWAPDEQAWRARHAELATATATAGWASVR
jgi:hypothetical protein